MSYNRGRRSSRRRRSFSRKRRGRLRGRSSGLLISRGGVRL